MGFRTRRAGLVAALVSALGGCGGDAIVPPPPPGLNAVGDPGSVSPEGSSLVLVAAPRATDEGREWEQAARMEAGRLRAGFSVSRPEPNDPPERQAALIREAAGRGISALLVDPVDDPAVVAALDEARDKGTAVVLLDPRVHDRDPARPLPRVQFGPLEESARRLVEAALAELRKAGLPADGHALIVLKIGAGPRAAETSERLTKVLTSAGFTGVETVSVVDNFKEAAKVLDARIAADPKVTTLLGVGDTQVRAAMTARDTSKKTAKRPLSVGGIVTLTRPFEMAGYNGCVGILDRNQPRLARRTVQAALDLARGEPTRTDLLVPIVYHEGIAGPKNDTETIPGPQSVGLTK